MRCLKHCPLMQDPVKAKICMLSYVLVSKNAYQMEIPNEFIILAKYGPLKRMFKLHFQSWTPLDIKLIFGH